MSPKNDNITIYVAEVLHLSSFQINPKFFRRAAFVFSLLILSNYMHRSGGESSKISALHQMVIWRASLMRGVVFIALAFKQ
ncbi:sodium/hydrogen exchanger 4 isoform X2, partial [Tanacetum coccineum]